MISILDFYDKIFCFYAHQLRLAIVEALGHMCHLMARDKLEEQLPRILAGILGLYRKQQEPFHITQVGYPGYWPESWDSTANTRSHSISHR